MKGAWRPSWHYWDGWQAIAWAIIGVSASGFGFVLTSLPGGVRWALAGVSVLLALVAFLILWGTGKTTISISLHLLEELVDDSELLQGEEKDRHPYGTVRIVSPAAGGWVIQRPHAERIGRSFNSQSEALRAAREYLSREGGGQLIVHGMDGRIRDLDSVEPHQRHSANA